MGRRLTGATDRCNARCAQVAARGSARGLAARAVVRRNSWGRWAEVGWPWRASSRVRVKVKVEKQPCRCNATVRVAAAASCRGTTIVGRLPAFPSCKERLDGCGARGVCGHVPSAFQPPLSRPCATFARLLHRVASTSPCSCCMSAAVHSTGTATNAHPSQVSVSASQPPAPAPAKERGWCRCVSAQAIRRPIPPHHAPRAMSQPSTTPTVSPTPLLCPIPTQRRVFHDLPRLALACGTVPAASSPRKHARPSSAARLVRASPHMIGRTLDTDSASSSQPPLRLSQRSQQRDLS
jgi:hypothetical protein